MPFWLHSTLLSFHYAFSFSISFCPLCNNENHHVCLFFLHYLWLLNIECEACPALLFRSHLIRQEERARWCVCIASHELMCSNLIFSSDVVKQLYLEYMSLFKFMRSDGAHSVIWIICTLSWERPPSSLVTTMWAVSVGYTHTTRKLDVRHLQMHLNLFL